MSLQNRTVLKSYFQSGDKPTQSQFESLIDSSFNKVEDAPAPAIGTAGSIIFSNGTILTQNNSKLKEV